MKVGIVGYGNMGREVEIQLRKRSHEVVFRSSPRCVEVEAKTLAEVSTDILKNTDVLIEFSLPSAVKENAKTYSSLRMPTVIGTTGWEADKIAVEAMIKNSQICCVYGANFSIGAHVFARIAEYTARIVNALPEYDVALSETHHTKKKDRPSGTALMTADRVLRQLERKTHLAVNLPEHSAIANDALAVVSQRVGYERGFHELVIDSDFDTIALSHKARSRAGFALGAVLAAEWLTSYKHMHKGKLIPVELVMDALLSHDESTK